MNVDIQEYIVKHIVVSLAGRIDAFSVPGLQAQLDACLKDGIKHFIIDMTLIQFMDSAGLAVMVKLLKRVRQVNGTISLIMPQAEAARRILRLTHFDQIFDLADSVDAAISGL
jgi:anti-sigma B factor antagonist